eukprot:1597691-Amphidinium_carterae.8
MENSCADEHRSLLHTLLGWLLADPSWSQLSSQLQEAEGESERSLMVADAFADKATGTLKMRVNSLKRVTLAIRNLARTCHSAWLLVRGSPSCDIAASPNRYKTLVCSACLLACLLAGVANSSVL